MHKGLMDWIWVSTGALYHFRPTLQGTIVVDWLGITIGTLNEYFMMGILCEASQYDDRLSNSGLLKESNTI